MNCMAITHPFWGVGNGVQGEPQLDFLLSHTLVFVLCLPWRNPRLLYNDFVKISTVRELLKESCEVFQNKSTWGLVIPLASFVN